jgi:3-hydroxybutyryl-CoA dehydrogenase
MAGLNVTMYGRSDASLKRGFSAIKEDLGRLESQGELDDGTCKSILDRIKGVKTIEEASKGTDFVIESLAEDLQIKRKFFEKLDCSL